MYFSLDCVILTSTSFWLTHDLDHATLKTAIFNDSFMIVDILTVPK